MAQRVSHPLAPQSRGTENGAEAQEEAGTPFPHPRVTQQSRAGPRAQGGPAWPHGCPLFTRHGVGMVNPGSARRSRGALARPVEDNEPAED